MSFINGTLDDIRHDKEVINEAKTPFEIGTGTLKIVGGIGFLIFIFGIIFHCGHIIARKTAKFIQNLKNANDNPTQ